MTDDQKNQIRQALSIKGFSNEQIDKSTISFSSTTESHVANISVPVSPKQFIKQVLINELDNVVKISPWLGFICISNGIEFLGKCIDNENPTDWNAERVSRKNFNDAIKNINALEKYRILLNRTGFDLYSEFRCGLSHACAPKDNMSLSHGTQEQPNILGETGVVNFNADELYLDFKTACEEVVNMDFPETDKMNIPKMFINCVLTSTVIS